MKKFILLTLFLVGCSSSANNIPARMPSGTHWVSADCRGLTQLQCYTWYEVKK
jgi:hypothetical protein